MLTLMKIATQNSIPSHSHCISKVLWLKLLNLLFLIDSRYLYTNETHCSFIYYTRYFYLRSNEE